MVAADNVVNDKLQQSHDGAHNVVNDKLQQSHDSAPVNMSMCRTVQ